MRNIVFLAAGLTALNLFSCRTHKTVTDVDQSSTISFIDTTKLVSDTAVHKANAIDTTKTTATLEGGSIIEFVEGGGKVSITPEGNVILAGVKSITERHNDTLAQDKGVSRQVEDAAVHLEQANGIEARQSDYQKLTEEKIPAKRWYETLLVRIGQGVFIAALLWLIFLYLRRKL